MIKFQYLLSSVLLFLCLVACTHKYTSQEEIEQRLIPQPKELIITDSRLYPICNITIDSLTKYSNPDEYYITAHRGKVTIAGNEVWARQTLRQLQGTEGRIPDITIHDWATYPMRIFMHDCGRNYQPIAMLEETIDLMSFYKLNYFHWHLTDNPGWRIECKCHPQLNDTSSYLKGRDEGKFYTYDEIRHLIAYASARGITIIPEIDMPGHSKCFERAFGVTMNSVQGMNILKDILTEFFTEISELHCPYFHIGSDEIAIDNPEEFMKFVEGFVQAHHRIPLVWDPGLKASNKAIRQIWNESSGSNAAASQTGGKYIDSFVGYLNYYDPIAFTTRLFLHTAAAQETPDTTRALGGALCLWNDVRVDDKRNIALHNGMLNGIIAFSERFWNGGNGGKDIRDENLTPNPDSEAGRNLATFERKMIYHRDHLLRNHEMRWVANSGIHWVVTIDGCQYDAWGGSIDLEALCASHGIELRNTIRAIAETHLWSERDTTIAAWVGFETIARSNRISTGIGQQGRWENDGELSVNGSLVLPPRQWSEAEAYNYRFNTWHTPEQEEPFTNEQLYWMRQPALIPLHAGDNTIRMVVLKQFKGHRWSFAFIPITLLADGKVREVNGVK